MKDNIVCGYSTNHRVRRRLKYNDVSGSVYQSFIDTYVQKYETSTILQSTRFNPIGHPFTHNIMITKKEIKVLQKYDVLYLPGLIPNHWLLFVIHLPQKTIYIYNPQKRYYSKSTQVMRSVIRKIKQFLKPTQQKWGVVFPKCDQQVTHSSCGYYVLMYLDKLLNNCPCFTAQNSLIRLKRFKTKVRKDLQHYKL
jgi:hypothetical protein